MGLIVQVALSVLLLFRGFTPTKHEVEVRHILTLSSTAVFSIFAVLALDDMSKSLSPYVFGLSVFGIVYAWSLYYFHRMRYLRFTRSWLPKD